MSDSKRHLWYLRKLPALAMFSPAALAQLASAADLHERPRKTCLYLAGDIADRVYFLHGGRVHAIHVTDGSRMINLGLYGPTDIFGESCLWTPAPREHQAVSATAVLYTEVPRVLLRLLLDDHPAAARHFAEQAIAHRDLVIRRLRIAMSTSVRARLADQLLALGEQGRDTPEGRELAFPLTHHELAALIGTTRETVSVELQRLRREGLIDCRGRLIVLHDPAKLRIRAREVSHGGGRGRAPPQTLPHGFPSALSPPRFMTPAAPAWRFPSGARSVPDWSPTGTRSVLDQCSPGAPFGPRSVPSRCRVKALPARVAPDA